MMKQFKEILKGERIELRILEPTFDLAKMIYQSINENREYLLPWMRWASKKIMGKPEDSFKYLISSKEERKKGLKYDYGIFLEDEYLGNIGIFDISGEDKSGEIGYWLKKSASGKGYMNESVKLIEDEFFDGDALNRIMIRCDEDNKPSANVAKRLGYVFEGIIRNEKYSETRGQFINYMVFSKLKKEWKKGK